MEIPRQIGDFLIEKVIGQGGMGVVYLGSNADSTQHVAIKTIRGTDNFQIATIRREIHALRQISHPGIVGIVADGIFDGIPWYAMEFLEGLTLRQYFRKKSYSTENRPLSSSDSTHDKTLPSNLDDDQTMFFHESVPGEQAFTSDNRFRPQAKHAPFPDVLRIVSLLCEPLAYLHGEGMVHRDLKPDNIIIRAEGSPVLVDFGLITLFSGEMSRERLSVERGYVGTVSYMAPEQIRGEYVDARADIYALGCILYELLTGHPPFVGNRVKQILQAHLSAQPISPRKFRPEIPPALDELILKLLSKNPQERIGYAEIIARQLEQLSNLTIPWLSRTKAKSYLYRSRFIGQNDVFTQLQNQLKSLVNGSGSMINLAGQSGLGKTRMLMELGREASRQNIQVITGEFSQGTVHSLAGFTKFFQRIADHCREEGREKTDKLLGRRGKILASYGSGFTSLPGQSEYEEPLELAAETAKFRLFAALLETIILFAQDSPLLFLFDDIQWADELTLEFFAYILRSEKLDEMNFMILNAYREESVSEMVEELLHFEQIIHVNMDPLKSDDISKIIGDMLALEVPPQLFCEYLVRHAEGNPLFAAEYLRTAVEEKILWIDSWGIWHVSVDEDEIDTADHYEKLSLPLSLQGLTERRLAGLAVVARHFIETLAVIGREAQLHLAKKVSALSEKDIQNSLHELEVRQLIEIRTSEILHITQNIVRDLLLAQMKEIKRVSLHRKTAEFIESHSSEGVEGFNAILASHWEGAQEWDRAKKYFLIAARNAKKRYHFGAALKFYQSYLSHISEENKETIQVRLEYATDILIQRGMMSEAQHELKIVCRESQDRNLQKQNLLSQIGEASIYRELGEIEKARQLYESALQQATKTLSVELECSVYMNLSILMFNMGDFIKAREFNQKAFVISGKISNPATKIQVMINRAVYSMGVERPEKVITYFEQGLAAARKLQNKQCEIRILLNMGTFYRDLGKLKTARELFEETINRTRESGDKPLECATLLNLAISTYEMGEQEQSRELFKKAIKLSRQTKDKRKEAIGLGLLASFSQEVESYSNLRNLYESALILNREVGDIRFETQNLLNFGLYLFNHGEFDEVYEMFNRALELARATGEHRLLSNALKQLATYERFILGNYDVAEEKLMEAYEMSKKFDIPFDCIVNLVQLGFAAIANGKSAKKYIDDIEKYKQRFVTEGKDPTEYGVVSLKIAQSHFENEEPEKIFRGEPLDRINSVLRKYANKIIQAN